jgi:hypothetical protein
MPRANSRPTRIFVQDKAVSETSGADCRGTAKMLCLHNVRNESALLTI